MRTLPRAGPGSRGRKSGCLVFSLGICLLVAVTGHAQTAQVYVTASLVDRNHLFVENLTSDEVRILEDGNPRAIRFNAMDQLPTAYGILIERSLMPEADVDVRSAMAGATLAKNILLQLIDKYLGYQQVWMGSYQKDPEDLLDFTGDSFRMKEAVQELTGPHGNTESFLYPALFSAVQKMCERTEKRRVLLLFLEAIDLKTVGKLRPLKNLLATSNIELFVVSFTSRLSTRGGLSPAVSDASLKELAGSTAGEFYAAGLSKDHPEDVVRRLVMQLRTLHTFGFESTSPADNPGRLLIECSRPGSSVQHHPLVPVLCQ